MKLDELVEKFETDLEKDLEQVKSASFNLGKLHAFASSREKLLALVDAEIEKLEEETVSLLEKKREALENSESELKAYKDFVREAETEIHAIEKNKELLEELKDKIGSTLDDETSAIKKKLGDYE